MDAEAYAAKLHNYIGAGCAAISIAMATETGLLDVLLNAESPLTSQEIADKKDLKERYVQDLLGSLVTAEVIQVDTTSTMYHVPVTFKPALRAISHMCRFVPYYGQRYPSAKECFPREGPEGVSISSSEVTDLMESYRESNKENHIDYDILAVVPGLKDKLEKGIVVGEFGSGMGTVLNRMAARFPASTFTGSDVNKELVRIAQKDVTDCNLTNISFEVVDLYDLPFELCNKFDWIYVNDVIHELAYPGKALLGIHRALKPGGMFSMLGMCLEGNLSADAGNLNACFLYTTSMLDCLPESSQHEHSTEVGLCWTKDLAQYYLGRAGFKITKIAHNSLDNHAVHFVCEI